MDQLHRGNFDSNVWFLEHIDLLESTDGILEIGSGNGTLVNYLHIKGFSNIIGTELNKECISFAQTEFGINLQMMGGELLDFPNDHFDFTISFDVLEHIPDTNKHLQEVSRILKPKGYYLLGTPNKLTNIPYSIWKDKSFTKYREYHVSLHTYNALADVFDKHGFDVEFIDVPVINDYFLAKIKKYFGSIGITLVKLVDFDKIPLRYRTNFYVIAQKR